jgi:hypothetical protein
MTNRGIVSTGLPSYFSFVRQSWATLPRCPPSNFAGHIHLHQQTGDDFMLKQIRNLTFCVALGAAPFVISPAIAHAQQVNEDQRAYQTGFQNGVNDAQRGRQMNMSTGDWHGTRLNMYQEGYQKGYESVKGHEHEGMRGAAAYQGEDRKAYDAGYQRGVDDAEHHRAMNNGTGDWHGDRLNIYQEGYQQGYRGGH